jgi:hypothetical protein
VVAGTGELTVANQKVVFIHGSDPKQAETPWMFYHLHPSAYSKPARTEGKSFDLVYFDYEKGKRKDWTGWAAARGRTPPPGGVEGDILPRANLRDASGTPYPGPLRVGTAVAFYEWVKRQPSGSISSIQIFSHATGFQPVLFPESYEWGDDGIKQFDFTEPRDPNDSEFRMRDFEGNNPLATNGADPFDRGTGSEMQRFKRALAPDVFIKIWGCGEQFMQPGLGNTLRKYLSDYLKVRNGKGADLKRAMLLLSYLNSLDDFFPYRLAERLDLPVWAGPMGWGTDPYEVDGKYDPKTYAKEKYTYVGNFPPNLKKKEQWWRASMHFLGEPRYTKDIFQKALKAKVDPVGYIEYRRSWVTAAVSRLQRVITPPDPSDPFAIPARLMDALTEKMRKMGIGESPSQ